MEGGSLRNVDREPPPQEIDAGHDEVLEGYAELFLVEKTVHLDGIKGERSEKELVLLESPDPVEVPSPLSTFVGEDSLHLCQIAWSLFAHALSGVARDFLHGSFLASSKLLTS